MQVLNISKRKKLLRKISRRALLARKQFKRTFQSPVVDKKQILFILGCQRSGTTLMTYIMEKDWDAKVYAEHSNLSSDDRLDGLRLNSLDKVKRTIAHDRYPLIVLKPLVESQNADILLDFFYGSKALWMVRHYKDVAASNLRRFGLDNGIKNLRYIMTDQNNNWRAERLPDYVRELVKSHFSETMNPYDAAALFWFVRNTIYFDLALDRNPAVRVCQYRELVKQPKGTMQAIYAMVNRPYPGDEIIEDVFKSSVGKGEHIELSPAIENHCREMWLRLTSASSILGAHNTGQHEMPAIGHPEKNKQLDRVDGREGDESLCTSSK